VPKVRNGKRMRILRKKKGETMIKIPKLEENNCPYCFRTPSWSKASIQARETMVIGELSKAMREMSFRRFKEANEIIFRLKEALLRGEK
jgi:hypothetical protein